MTEKGFWRLVNEIQARNRPKLLATGAISSDDPKELEEAKRIYGNKADTGELEEFPESKITDIGQLLFNKDVSLKAKQVIIMTLAHKESSEAVNALKEYNKSPDEELKYFAHFALQECQWWNE